MGSIDLKQTQVERLRSGNLGISQDDPLDALVLGAGPSGIVALRTLLRNDPPLSVVAIDRQPGSGGVWRGHIPAYSTLQDLKIEYEVHGVKFPKALPERRAPRDEIVEFCDTYVKEFSLNDFILWKHDVKQVTMIKPMLFQIDIRPAKDQQPEMALTKTIFARSVVVCTGHNIVPYIPKFKGMETATFPIRHNNHIREIEEMPEKGIIIIGAGPSALDIVQAGIQRGAKDITIVARVAHYGIPDQWFPWMWKFGWSELHVLRVLYGLLPVFVVDTILYIISMFWAYWHGVPEWAPPSRDPCSAKVGYMLRTHLVKPYHDGIFRIKNDTSIKLIDRDTVYLTDGTILKPKMIVAATGWSTDSSYLPGGQPAGEYDTLAAADVPNPLYLRFIDTKYYGMFYISMSNDFMAYTENSALLSQAVEQILRGTWTLPSKQQIGRNIREVVLKTVGLPGLLPKDLEREGFKNIKGKNER